MYIAFLNIAFIDFYFSQCFLILLIPERQQLLANYSSYVFTYLVKKVDSTAVKMVYKWKAFKTVVKSICRSWISNNTGPEGA